MRKKQNPPKGGVAPTMGTASRPKDNRQPLLLDPITGEDAITLLNHAIRQALDSPQMQIVVRNILKGRRQVLNSIGKDEPDLPWGIRLQNVAIGKLYLIPQRAEDELNPEKDAEAMKVATSAAPAEGSVIGRPQENERLARAAALGPGGLQSEPPR